MPILKGTGNTLLCSRFGCGKRISTRAKSVNSERRHRHGQLSSRCMILSLCLAKEWLPAFQRFPPLSISKARAPSPFTEAAFSQMKACFHQSRCYDGKFFHRNENREQNTMKITIRGISTATAILLVSAVHSIAIEGLGISVHCPDVVLSWPSLDDETYIVQYRANLSTNTPWTTLTNSLPADSTTNRTTFVHSNQVQCASGDTNSISGGGGGSPPAPSLVVIATPTPHVSGPLARRADGSGSPVPLCIYPPGFDLSGLMILDPSTGEWVNGSAYTISQPSRNRLQHDGPQPQDDDPIPPDPGFYQVVRVGAHVFGLTNGAVLSGIVPLPLEFGNNDTNGTLALLFLSDTDTGGGILGSSFPEFPSGPAQCLTGTWDTMQVTNGTYTIQMGATLDDETEYLDNPVTVTVSNLVWFADPWNVAGEAIYIGVQTPYTDGTGTWHADFYDDQGTWDGYIDGPIDQDGWFAYPGDTGPFSVDNTDGYGNQNPSTSYSLVYSTDAAHPIWPFPAYTNVPMTNVVFVEPNWNFLPTGAAVVYQPVFDDAAPLGQEEIMILMQGIASAEQAASHPLLLGTSDLPFQVGNNGYWTNTIIPVLQDSYCRDFIWMGHGSSSSLGSGPLRATSITEPMIAAALTNNASNPLKGPNQHPYRFVFLDGCNTANGDWPLAFGIPKQRNMKISDFTDKRGLRPRAFLGWNKGKGYRYVNAGLLELNFEQWNGNFWTEWNARNDLTAAIIAAKNNPGGGMNTGNAGYVVYGAGDLNIDR
jgi:hypothetical protein